MRFQQPAVPIIESSPYSEFNWTREMAVAMRLAGFTAAFAERCIELQVALAIHAVREWAQLLVAAQRAGEGVVGNSLLPAQPLGGRRRTPSRRDHSVVINFPERRRSPEA